MYSMLGFVPNGFWSDVTCFDLSDAVGRCGTVASCSSGDVVCDFVCRDDVSQRSEACVCQTEIVIFVFDHMEIDSKQKTDLQIHLN